MYTYGKKVLNCPVCDERLGYLSKGDTNTFLCKECNWFFTFDDKGVAGKAVKNTPPKKGCNCGGCSIRATK